jgi:transcriptional regulator PpsR
VPLEEGEAPDLQALSPWARELARTFVTLSSDIALVLDAEGVITDVSQGSGNPVAPSAGEWIGRAWSDTVTGETRAKIDAMLEDVAARGLGRRREVNHPGAAGGSIPVAYTAVRLGAGGPVLAVGRDLRATAAIQQRFLEAQQDIERGYWRARQAESRYRLLFQVATDAVLVVDAETMRIVEANQAASQLFDLPVAELRGRSATFGFERPSRQAVDELLLNARSTGRAGEIGARLVGRVQLTSVAATPFRADDAMRLLVRVRGVDASLTNGELSRTLARLVDGTRDGVVVADSSGAILLANPAFVALVGALGEAALRGRALADWFASDPAAFDELLRQVRLHGIARRVESRLRAGDRDLAVEVSAALLTEGDQECIGFTIHPLAALAAAQPATEPLRAGLERLAASLGERPLATLMHEAGGLVERFLLQAALERSGDDPDAAARLLGLTRHGFDERRHGGGASER